ncbi:hypothetical protein B0J11DRAFT_520989 [Dendryphion nanum]|uniref:BRCT domain-containing protein n=1 Tax=Dendryphion nanum TaxID=256645 RepID=A0A9P9IVC8_9PLEO|nr:hypothetical protein B0J11DRAFT_520989 [Dendryphion nanum]
MFRLTVSGTGAWSIKLQQDGQVDICVQPAQPRHNTKVEPPLEEHKMMNEDGPGKEVLFLRESDSIYTPNTTSCLKLVWHEVEIQVNSSLNGETTSHQTTGGEDQSDTEDDEDLDRTIGLHTNIQPTPAPSIARSEVVQETPQTDRILLPNELSILHSAHSNEIEVETPDVGTSSTPMEQPAPHDMQLFSSAHLDQTTTMDLDEEQPAEVYLAVEASPKGRTRNSRPLAGTKRTKIDDVDQSENSLTPKQKKARVIPQDQPSPRTRASSQASTDDGPYIVSKPKVAFTNSAIPESPAILKFLKTHNGTQVESVKTGDCTIICTRSGQLKKSMKLLLGIALGVPIVADAWLTESAKQGRFLDLKRYVPESLSGIWGVPQRDLLRDKIVYFTSALRAHYTPFREVEQVCKAVGAKKVSTKPGKELKISEKADIVLFALNETDPEVATFTENGHTCYSRDMLTHSILRGFFDFTSDDFRLNPPKKRGRPRK